jgi:uncharacterized protein (DUF4415 family)
MIKVDADLYEALVAAGEGWQERLNDGLRKIASDSQGGAV